MKQMTLTTAVLLAIKSYNTDTFSIYDLTRAIRQDVNDGEYEIKDLGTDIPHHAVKGVFAELQENGFLDDHLEEVDYAEGYRKFTWQDDTIHAYTPPPTPVITTNTSMVPNPPLTPTLGSKSFTPITPYVQDLIVKYITSRGITTVKQIQSRLKKYNYTCDTIKDFLLALHVVDPATINNPPSLVKTIDFS
jgi:hypothetical protein